MQIEFIQSAVKLNILLITYLKRNERIFPDNFIVFHIMIIMVLVHLTINDRVFLSRSVYENENLLFIVCGIFISFINSSIRPDWQSDAFQDGSEKREGLQSREPAIRQAHNNILFFT